MKTSHMNHLISFLLCAGAVWFLLFNAPILGIFALISLVLILCIL